MGTAKKPTDFGTGWFGSGRRASGATCSSKGARHLHEGKQLRISIASSSGLCVWRQDLDAATHSLLQGKLSEQQPIHLLFGSFIFDLPHNHSQSAPDLHVWRSPASWSCFSTGNAKSCSSESRHRRKDVEWMGRTRQNSAGTPTQPLRPHSGSPPAMQVPGPEI